MSHEPGIPRQAELCHRKGSQNEVVCFHSDDFTIVEIMTPPDNPEHGSADKLCAFHLLTDSFLEWQLYKEYAQNKTSLEKSDDACFSHKARLLDGEMIQKFWY